MNSGPILTGTQIEGSKTFLEGKIALTKGRSGALAVRTTIARPVAR